MATISLRRVLRGCCEPPAFSLASICAVAIVTPVSSAPPPSVAAFREDDAKQPSVFAELEDGVPRDASSNYVDAFVDCRGGNTIQRINESLTLLLTRAVRRRL